MRKEEVAGAHQVSRPAELAAASIDRLDLSPEVKAALREIQGELADAYRDSFLAMVDAINRQASAIDRIQATLDLLIRHTTPSLIAQLPPFVRVAASEEQADLASAVVVADPIGAGFTLSVSAISNALGLPATDVGYLLKAFKIAEDGKCAVVVRRGGIHNTIVNYSAAAIQKFLHLVANPPAGLTRDQKSAIARVTRKLVLTTQSGDVPAAAPPEGNDPPHRDRSRGR